jgi:hypothetical protein
MLFIKKLQQQPKVRSIRSKIRKAEVAKKKLSSEYKRALKSEAARLSKQIKKSKKSKRSRKSKKTRSRKRS